MRAVNSRSIRFARCSFMRLTTAKAVKVGTSAVPFLKVYSRRRIVSMIDA